jgi:hypothetical protein
MRAEAESGRPKIRASVKEGCEGIDQGGATFAVVRRDWAEMTMLKFVETFVRAEARKQVFDGPTARRRRHVHVSALPEGGRVVAGTYETCPSFRPVGLVSTGGLGRA